MIRLITDRAAESRRSINGCDALTAGDLPNEVDGTEGIYWNGKAVEGGCLSAREGKA
jgi:hypothetical protein